jgi:hypothetical protein
MASFDRSSGSDIQENINILLDGYPFLKVFSRPRDLDIFSKANFDIINQFDGMYFKINIVDGRAVSASPYLITNNHVIGNEVDETQDQIAMGMKTDYLTNKPLIENYVRYQLINSGVLDFLPNVPITRGHTNKRFKRIYDPITKQFVRWEPSPEFESIVFVRLQISITSILSTRYHNDSNLFQILQYDQTDSKKRRILGSANAYVLGSELLFYHENDYTTIHRRLKKDSTGESVFSTEIMGDLVVEKHNLVKKIYNTIKAEGLSPPLLRHKLHNGDTMVFPDTLWKHAVIDAKENRDANIIHIDVANTYRETNIIDVNVCAERIPTNSSEYDGRRLIGLFCGILEVYLEPQYLLEPFSLLDDGPTKIEEHIPTINFDEGECTEFLSQLSRGDGCITITDVATETSAVILNRGGAKHRKAKTNTNKRRRVKRRKTNKRRTPRKKYIKRKTT